MKVLSKGMFLGFSSRIRPVHFVSMFDQNLNYFFFAESFNFDQTYLNTGLKTQNVEELSLDLIFHINFW